MQSIKRTIATGVVLLLLISFSAGPGRAQSPAIRPAPSPHFDISRTPFSYRGSYMAIHRLTSLLNLSAPGEADGIILRDISKRQLFKDFIRLQVVKDGKVVTPEIEARPEELVLRAGGGVIRICFENADVIRVRGEGLGLRLHPSHQSYAVRIGDHLRLTTADANGSYWMISALKGSRTEHGVNGDSTKPNVYQQLDIDLAPGGDGVFEAAVEQFISEWKPREYTVSYDSCVARTKRQFAGWVQRLPRVAAEYDTARALAGYVNWSCEVQPRGQMKREAMLMSKNWMNQIWSWDHCFNAIAMSPGDPEVGWNQFACIFDHQGPLGSLPDSYDNEKELWGILKTPVHGWALQRMMESSRVLTGERMNAIYPKLSAWTNFWFTYRDPDGNGVPQYNHSYESFDDTPPFDVGLPSEAPELASFLIVQMDVLSELATRLNKGPEAQAWHRRADTLTARMVRRLWNGEKFIAINTVTGKWNEGGDSFLSYVPLILGARLPKEIRDKMIAGLKKEKGLLTPFGMTTESVSSPYFNTDSYTRGSIWAPVNYILADALDRAGERDMAREIARRYCGLLARNGFAERADALTGESKSDPEYTWTSSIFLILASRYLR